MARVIVLEKIKANLQITKWRTFHENSRFIYQYHKEQEAIFPGSFLHNLNWKLFFVDLEAQDSFDQGQKEYGYEEYEEDNEEYLNQVNWIE